MLWYQLFFPSLTIYFSFNYFLSVHPSIYDYSFSLWRDLYQSTKRIIIKNYLWACFKLSPLSHHFVFCSLLEWKYLFLFYFSFMVLLSNLGGFVVYLFIAHKQLLAFQFFDEDIKKLITIFFLSNFKMDIHTLSQILVFSNKSF